MTPQEEEALKSRILKMEESLSKLLENVESRHPKADGEKMIAELRADLSDARKDLAMLKKPERGPDRDERSLADEIDDALTF